MPTKPRTKPTKTNPEPETITVELPREMPRGLKFHYHPRFGWVWTASTKKAIHTLVEMAMKGAK